ncbi:MAG TPA: glycosyltransferase family 2 protein [Candidatus Glassbacteria bacterium]|nr:glycosyltransferase family 2 protein [Candidatus Glassbacteria bacterium]
MLDISVVIITLDAELVIGPTLASTGFAREVVVVDSGSTDRTVEFCEKAGARVISRQWSGYGPQKNFAIGQASCPWVLSLDADEVVSSELAAEISALEDSTPYAGFRIPRLNHYFGRGLRHGGQYPDLQLRLFRKSRGRFNTRPVHEAVELDGAPGRLSGEILHYSYASVDDYLQKFLRYTGLEAERLLAGGEKPTPGRLITRLALAPLAKFVRRYFIKLGFLDGLPGFLAAIFTSFTMIASYARFWDKYRSHSSGAQRPDR